MGAYVASNGCGRRCCSSYDGHGLSDSSALGTRIPRPRMW